MTSDCERRLQNLTSTANRVLDEDLAALSRMSERLRIEKYNEIKADEETLLWEFQDDCPDVRTEAEFDRIRSELRLARLLIAASFRRDGSVPAAMEGDFAEKALTAAVEFERYKQFDALSEDQINRRIRRMEGEVYELVTDYTDSQLANMDDLLESPHVQQDVIRQLTDRYDQRLEKARQGFYTYVEAHGMQHMVSAVEEAITTVSESQQTQTEVEAAVRTALESVESQLEAGFERHQRAVEQRLRGVERELAASDPDVAALREEIERLDSTFTDDQYRESMAELEATIAETQSLKDDLESQLEELQTAKRDSEDDDGGVADDVADIVDEELGELRSQREAVQGEIDRLQRERERMEVARDRLEDRQESLHDRVETIESSVTDADGGIDGEAVVTSPIARLLELDYVGRFETAMHDADSLYLGDESFEVPDGYWEDRSERRNERPRLATLLDDDQAVERFPVNRTARYEVTSSEYLGLSKATEMVVEATVVSNLEAHAKNGFDASPADLDDLLEYVNRSVYEAERDDVTYLLGIASPTGWSESVRERIRTDDLSRTRFSRHLSVVLVDLQDGSVVSDSSDPVASRNESLFALAVDDERVAGCVRDAEERFDGVGVASDSLLLETLVDEEGYDPHVVKRAFDRLGDRPGYSQQYVDDQLVLFADGPS